MITDEELNELKTDVLKVKSGEEIKKAKLVYDGRQYSIRFPKHFIENAEVDMEKDYFEIKLTVFDYETDKKPEINVSLIRKDEEEKTLI